MKKQKSLAERIAELKPEVNAEIERLAEERRPKDQPAAAIRQMWMARAGFNPFEALLIAAKEGK